MDKSAMSAPSGDGTRRLGSCVYRPHSRLAFQSGMLSSLVAARLPFNVPLRGKNSAGTSDVCNVQVEWR
eukprot:4100061-Pyramimonas_sp.AAC.1